MTQPTSARASSYDFRQQFGYVLVALACGAAGYLTAHQYDVANGLAEVSLITSLSAMERPTVIAVVGYLLCLVAFLFARYQAVDLVHDQEAMKNRVLILIVVSTALATVVPIVAGLLLSAHVLMDLVCSLSLVLLAAIVPMLAILTRTVALLKSGDSKKVALAYSFPMRIFFPALCTCMVSFLLGWTLNQGNDGTEFTLLGISTVLSIVVLLSGRSPKSTRKTILAFAVVLLLAPVAARYYFEHSIAIGVLTALFIAFGMGVTEVTNRLGEISQGTDNYYLAAGESQQFYKAGANWSAFAFIPFVPLLGLFFPSVPVWLLYLYTLTFLMIWIRNDDKATKGFSKVSTGLGFGLPVILILGLYVGTDFPEFILLFGGGAESATLSDRITTILGVLLTIIFVLLQSDYQVLMRGYRKPETFLSPKNCMLLFFVVISFVSIYALVVTSILERVVDGGASLNAKIDEFQIWSLILISTILVLYIWDSGDGEGSDDEVDKPTAKPSKATRASRTSVSMLSHVSFTKIFSMGRFPVSVIAGILLGAIFVAKGQPASVVGYSVLSMTFVTMFGFVINDIFDLRKDRLGQRIDKVLVTEEITLAQAKWFAFSLLLASWWSSWLAFGHSGLTFVLTLGIALTVYSPFTRSAPLFKGLYTAVLCASPLIFANLMLKESSIPIELIGFTIVFFVGRELVIDANDIDADSKAGLRTLAVILGRELGLFVGWIVMVAGFVILASTSEGVGKYVALIGLTLILGLGYLATRDARLATKWTRLPLLFGAVAMAYAL